MKHIFKQTKVVYDAHMQEYCVYVKNFLFWKYDRSYKVDDKYLRNETAKEMAITYAKNILNTVEVYRSK
jgi:hypothetical protein